MCIINNIFGCKTVKDLKDQVTMLANSLYTAQSDMRLAGAQLRETKALLTSKENELDTSNTQLATVSHQVQDYINRNNDLVLLMSQPNAEVVALNEEVNKWQQNYSTQLREVERLTAILKENGLL